MSINNLLIYHGFYEANAMKHEQKIKTGTCRPVLPKLMFLQYPHFVPVHDRFDILAFARTSSISVSDGAFDSSPE